MFHLFKNIFPKNKNNNILTTSIPLFRTLNTKNIKNIAVFNNNIYLERNQNKYFSSFSSVSFVAGANTSKISNVIYVYYTNICRELIESNSKIFIIISGSSIVEIGSSESCCYSGTKY